MLSGFPLLDGCAPHSSSAWAWYRLRSGQRSGRVALARSAFVWEEPPEPIVVPWTSVQDVVVADTRRSPFVNLALAEPKAPRGGAAPFASLRQSTGASPVGR